MSVEAGIPKTEQEAELLKQLHGGEIKEVPLPAPAVAAELAEKRVMIAPLLAAHATAIEKLRHVVSGMLEAAKADESEVAHMTDNIFLLRFLVAAKFKIDDALPALKMAVDYRVTNRDVLRRIREDGFVPGADEMRRYSIANMHKTTREGGPVIIVRLAVSDMSALTEKLPRDLLYHAILFGKEEHYLLCDKLTRERGYFVDSMTIMDVGNSSMTKLMNRTYFNILGDVMKVQEPVYPLVNGPQIIVNAPYWFRWVFSAASVFLPQATLDKTLMSQNSKPTYEGGVCPVLEKYIPLENLPTFLGGSCKCDANAKFPAGRCICNVDNARIIPVTEAPLQTE